MFPSVFPGCLSPRSPSGWGWVFSPALGAFSNFPIVQNLDGQADSKLHC